MDTLKLTRKDIEFLDAWASRNIDLLDFYLAPVGPLKIEISRDEAQGEWRKTTLKCFRQRGNIIIHVNVDDKPKGNITMEFAGIGKRKYRTKLNHGAQKLAGEFRQSICSLYMQVMAFMVHGNSTVHHEEPKEKIAKETPQKNKAKPSAKQKQQESITYILRTDSKSPGIVPQGKRGKIEGSWGVRGHYRKYKTGKIIWVHAYKKGEGKAKTKNYRLRKGEKNENN